MKKILCLTALLTVLLGLSVQAQDTDKKEIEESGKTITRDISVQPFDQLDISGVFSVILLQGSAEAVKFEADENFQSLVDVKNEGSKLVISMKKNMNIRSKAKMKMYITFKKLKSMELKTVGDISSGQDLSFDDLKIQNRSVGSMDLKLTASNLNVDNKSVGDVRLGGKAESAVIRNSGVGSFSAASFVVQKLDIGNSGIGVSEVNAAKELKVKDSFLNKVKNKGTAAPRKTNKVVI